MQIRGVNNLPHRAKKMFKAVYDISRNTYSPIRSAKIALEIMTNSYIPARVGKKSMTVTQSSITTDVTSIDVLLGYPGVDKQVAEGGLKLSDSGWSNAPLGVLKGDMEHYYSDKAEGVYIDINEKWEGWVPVAQKFWVDAEGLHARVELPDKHPETPNFIKEWSSGKYGLSIDYSYPEEAVDYVMIEGNLIPEIQEWNITGFTFTEDPAFIKTKNGK